MTIAVEICLGLALIACWLGACGFTRLRTPLDRVHAVTFITATAGLALTIAAFLQAGASDRAFKILLILALNLLTGAVISHMTGRAITVRETTS